MKITMLALLLVVFSGTAAQAALILVNDRATLAGNDFIDWGSLGGAFTLVPSGTVVNSQDGLAVTVSETGGPMQRRDQGAAGGWAGNFPAADELLWTGFGSGPMRFDFVSNITGFGVQINDNSGAPGTATIEAFNSASVSLGSFVIPINSILDPAATFIGLRSTAQDIARIQISTALNNFAVNQADLVYTSRVVPEPGTIALMGLGLASLVVVRLRKSKAAATAVVAPPPIS